MPKSSDGDFAKYGVHRFPFTGMFKVAVIVSAIMVSTAINLLQMSAGFRAIVVILVAVSAVIYYRAVRDRAEEWRFNDRQLDVPVLDNWLHPPWNEQFVDRVRHVLTDEESEIMLITRRSIWKPILPTLGFALALGAFLYKIGLTWSYETTEIIEKRVGPRGNKRIKEIEVPEVHTTDLTMIVMVVVLVACVALALGWLKWLYTFFVKTNLYTYPHLTLPPVYLPWLDNNEESYANNRIGKVDNVNDVLGQMLRFGGVKFVSDLTKDEEPRVMNFMPRPRQMVIIMREGINASQRPNPTAM